MPDRQRRLTSFLSKVLIALLVLWFATSAFAQNNPPGSVEHEVAPTLPVQPRPPVPAPLPLLGTRRLPIAPNLVGLSVASAEAKVRAFNLGLRVREERAADAGAMIASQDPIAGTRMRPRGIITVTVTPAVVLVEVPDIIGRQIWEAERAVVAANLQLRIANESRSVPDTAVVISQEPPPHRRVKSGSTVTATVEVAPQVTSVPKIVGLEISAAEDRLRPSLVLSAPPTGRAWPSEATVATQSPEAGQRVPVGSIVAITVTAPPSPPAPALTPAPAPTLPLPAPEPSHSAPPLAPASPPTPSRAPQPQPTLAPLTAPIPAPQPPPASTGPPVLLPTAADLFTPVLWSVAGILLVALLGIAGRNLWKRHRAPLPVRLSLGREASRGRIVGHHVATSAAAPVVGVRLGAGPTVTTMRPITRSD